MSTWQPELDELAHRAVLAAELGGPERVARQRAAGRLTVREDAAALKGEIAARLEAVRSPFRTGESYLVEGVVDAADTRPLLCEWAEQAYAQPLAEPRGVGVRP